MALGTFVFPSVSINQIKIVVTATVTVLAMTLFVGLRDCILAMVNSSQWGHSSTLSLH
jgi:hypothetical protein